MPTPLEVDDDTIALWHFDQTGSGTLDDECSRLDLTTNSGGSSAVAGQTGMGNCRELDGSNDYFAADHSTDADFLAAATGTGDFTFEGWIYLGAGWNSTAWGSHHEIITIQKNGGGDEWAFIFALKKGDRTFSMAWNYEAGGQFSWEPVHPAIPLETWTHVALVRRWTGSAHLVIAMVNHEVVATTTTTGQVKLYTDLKTFIGVHNSLSFNYWPGRFDDFRISSVARYGFDDGYDQGYADGYAAGAASMPAPPDLTAPNDTRASARVEARIARLERLVDYLFGWLQSWKDLF